MAKIQLDVPDDLHRKIKRLQIEEEEKGSKKNLKDLYIELLTKALDIK